MPDKELTPEEIEKNLRIVRYARKWMKIKSLTQARLADQMGVSESALSKYLAGKTPMSFQHIADLTDSLEISLSELLTDPDDPAAARRLRSIFAIADESTEEDLEDILRLLRRRRER